jgi:hypothetical protein
MIFLRVREAAMAPQQGHCVMVLVSRNPSVKAAGQRGLMRFAAGLRDHFLARASTSAMSHSARDGSEAVPHGQGLARTHGLGSLRAFREPSELAHLIAVISLGVRPRATRFERDRHHVVRAARLLNKRAVETGTMIRFRKSMSNGFAKNVCREFDMRGPLAHLRCNASHTCKRCAIDPNAPASFRWRGHCFRG